MNNKIKKPFMNRLVFLLILYLVFISNLANAQVGIGTTNPDASSILDITSSNKGVLIPRADTLSIVNPAKGLIICDTATSTGLNYFYFNGVYWQSLGKNAGTFADSFNGNRIIKRPGWAGVSNVLNPGTTTNVVDFLNAVFFPFISAAISINGNVLYEIGTSNTVAISGSITLFDETLFSNGRVNENFAGLGDIYTFNSFPPYTYSTNFTFTPVATVASSLEYRFVAKVDVGNNGSATTIQSGTTKLVQSAYPYFCSVSSDNLTAGGTAVYTGLTKLAITAKTNKTVSLTGTNGYIYFCYPASYGTLTSILDPSLFQNLSAFTRYTASVTSVGLVNNWTTNYYIYKLNSITSLTSANFQFLY
jgi:hypothetical protein